MCRFLGALLIVAGCSSVGLKKAALYRRRTELFRFLQNGLTLLGTEINYTATPLPLALARVAQKVNQICRPLFATAAQVLREGKGGSVVKAWSEGVQALASQTPLTSEERELLMVFGHGLGGSAKEEQLKNISLTCQQLAIVEKVVREEEQRQQKMWQYLGFSVGVVIVLLLI